MDGTLTGYKTHPSSSWHAFKPHHLQESCTSSLGPVSHAISWQCCRGCHQAAKTLAPKSTQWLPHRSDSGTAFPQPRHAESALGQCLASHPLYLWTENGILQQRGINQYSRLLSVDVSCHKPVLLKTNWCTSATSAVVTLFLSRKTCSMALTKRRI